MRFIECLHSAAFILVFLPYANFVQTNFFRSVVLAFKFFFFEPVNSQECFGSVIPASMEYRALSPLLSELGLDSLLLPRYSILARIKLRLSTCL